MNASIISKEKVAGTVLDALAKELPAIIAEELDVPGGNLAPLKAEQISLAFSLANRRDTGSDVRIMAFARSNKTRTSTENELANTIKEKVVSVIARCGESYSVDIRLYFMDVGMSVG